MSKTLVAYFSASGSTARLAKNVAEAAAADIYEIIPIEAYTSADLDWMNKNSRSSVEMNDPASRVEIAGELPDLDAYDRILIGYPIWWGIAPHIINTFLESYDLTGKTVIPFATSGGSGMGNTGKYLGASVKGAELKEGKLLSSRTDRASIEKWLEE